ncbi:TIGR04283 family arsenosugar biosynthesis glycosyltransferase [Magnetococcales bacterium HHB-1]
MKPTLSIIIPTLNEAERLPLLLGQLQQQKGIAFEICIVDGGSKDGSKTVVETFQNRRKEENQPHWPVRWLASLRGRSIQMNHGASESHGSYLLFLHADSTLTDFKQLQRALNHLKQSEKRYQSRHVAGRFQLTFLTQNRSIPFRYQYYAKKAMLHRRGVINGDQGFLLSRDFFEKLGGFDESLPIMEDQRLAEQIWRQGRWTLLPGVLQTSARRFEREGFSRRMILNAFLQSFNAIGFHSFFLQAPHAYRAQTHADRLLLAPFCALIHQLNRSAGLKASWQRWSAIGRYVRQNFWQIFFLFDLRFKQFPKECSEKKRYKNSPEYYISPPLLSFHDRFIYPLLNFKIFDILTALLTALWFYSAWFYFTLIDHNR